MSIRSVRFQLYYSHSPWNTGEEISQGKVNVEVLLEKRANDYLIDTIYFDRYISRSEIENRSSNGRKLPSRFSLKSKLVQACEARLDMPVQIYKNTLKRCIDDCNEVCEQDTVARGLLVGART